MLVFRQTWELDDIEIVPIIIGATGLLKDNFKDLLKKVPGSPNLEETQLQAVKSTVSILKRALSCTDFKLNGDTLGVSSGLGPPDVFQNKNV